MRSYAILPWSWFLRCLLAYLFKCCHSPRLVELSIGPSTVRRYDRLPSISHQRQMIVLPRPRHFVGRTIKSLSSRSRTVYQWIFASNTLWRSFRIILILTRPRITILRLNCIYLIDHFCPSTHRIIWSLLFTQCNSFVFVLGR